MRIYEEDGLIIVDFKGDTIKTINDYMIKIEIEPYKLKVMNGVWEGNSKQKSVIIDGTINKINWG